MHRLVYTVDELPFNVDSWDDFVSGTHRLTGENFTKRSAWESLSEGAKARVLLEELSHQRRILMHGKFGRYVREITQELSHLAKFNEEALAAFDATGNILTALKYGWKYPGLNQWRMVGEGTVLGWIYYRFFTAGDDE